MEWPRWWCALRTRVRAIVRPERVEHDLDEELSFHIAMKTRANLHAGMTPTDAARRARVALGGTEATKESSRDLRPLRWLESTMQDLRYALRSLRRAPGFTLVAVVTLALGIGANTAIFSMVNGVILRPLAFSHPEQLMWLTTRFPALPEFWVSVPEYYEFRRLNQSFAEVGAYIPGEVSLTGSDQPRNVRAAFVDDHVIRALGLRAVDGRVFDAGETEVTGAPAAPGQPPILSPALAILSYEIWQTAFGGRSIVGQLVEVNGRRVTVVGVMAPGADVMDNRTEIWLPLGLNPANRARAAHVLYLVGRLKPDVTVRMAQQELQTLIATWAGRVGITPGQSGAAGHVFAPLNAKGDGHILQMKPLQDAVLGGASRAIWVLQACVGLVLLIACANLASLLLARAETRRREFAVRTALGAARGRLLQQFITEGVVLALLGAGLGLVVARLGVQTLLRLYPTSLPRTRDVALDPAVLLFTLSLSLVTGVLFGLAPFFHTRLRHLAEALKDSGAKGGSHSAARRSMRSALVASEVAVAVMLAIGASLLVRSVINLTGVDGGFDRSRVVTFAMTAPPGHYPRPSARVQLYQRLLEQLRAVPGVQAATAMSGLPPMRPINASDTEIEGYKAVPGGPPQNLDYYQNVMSDYFETMGIPIVEGRGFDRTDAHSTTMVTVVNETVVRTYWNGQNPIGKHLRVCCNEQFPWFTVIGVAKDVKQGGIDRKTGTEMYFLVDQTASIVPPPPGANLAGFGTMNVVLRTTLPVTALASTVDRVVHGVDPSVPVVRFREMTDVYADTIQRSRLLAQVVGLFAAVALLLAAIGTYGVLAYLVTERRREIGIRLALGADRVRVLTEVMRQGLRLALIGVIIGVAGAFGVNQLIASFLFGVRPTDVAIVAGTVPTILAIAALACWVPAWRASRVDPGITLRED